MALISLFFGQSPGGLVRARRGRQFRSSPTGGCFSRFNYMIPVPASELEEVTVNDEGDFKYKILMQSEYF